jgi:hypothetical protein
VVANRLWADVQRLGDLRHAMRREELGEDLHFAR